jgi:glycine hydroxymethyltransferase
MRILELIERHEQKRLDSINLVASENLLSPDARRAMQSDLTNRYCMPEESERSKNMWDYPNQNFVRQVNALVERYAREAFGGQYADTRPLSGNNVAYIILKSLVPAGGHMFSVPGPCGGHFTTPEICVREGFNLHGLPYDAATGNIDLDKLSALRSRVRPDLVFLDASMQLFPYPLRELRQLFGEETIISYDASHTMGLIAGGSFQRPLVEGADLVHGSTHKSLFGPQKGLIVCKNGVDHEDRIAARIKDIITPLFVSNMHIHNVAALGVAFEEMSAFGKDYARQVLKNAKAFGSALRMLDVDVLYPEQGFTECHQVMCRVGPKELMQRFLKHLEGVNIHVNGIKVPHHDAYGFRFGLAEVTRRGLKEGDLKWVAKAIADCLFARRPLEVIAGEVIDFARGFPGVVYVF